MITIDYLLKNSNLPGPRGNLELLYAFGWQASPEISSKCLKYIKPDTSNSPEEFVGMCGIMGYAISHRDNIHDTITFLKPYASHYSWRIREAVAMSIQEISSGKLNEILIELQNWITGSPLEQRAVVAALCEPKLLLDVKINLKVLAILQKITARFVGLEKLGEEEMSLRKVLGYGWSVLITALPDHGKKALEALGESQSKHVQWIVKNNLKKKRLQKLDAAWVKKMQDMV